jgi:hypothetical protein
MHEKPMRIPAGALGPYFNESGIFSESRQPRPVEALSGLRTDLPDALAKPGQPFENTIERTTERPTERTIERDGENGAEERRQGERRKKNTPSTLDTRVRRNRRKPAWPSTVSIKI